jgi:FMN-dependent oxidoreductase (nitrilotriacetate monooxygenase family)
LSSTRSDQMVLFLFASPTGYQPGAWKHPDSRVEDLYSLALQTDIAKRAEAAKLHAVFLADWLSFGDTGRNPDLTGYEPFTTMGALAAVTEKIGIIGTASTTFMEPFHLARYFSQLDFLSKGRIGWNIVTSSTGQENFNIDLPFRDERYQRALEYMDVVTGLWDCWEDDAVRADRSAGVWADRAKIHPLNHEGKHYKVEGPLLVPRSPQAWPVLVQAGSSPAGMDFAATFAEAVFTVKATLDKAQEFYGGVKGLLEQRGRSDKELRILPGLMPIVGDNEHDARQIHNELSDLIDFETGIKELTGLLHNADLSELEPHDVVPLERLVSPQEVHLQGGHSRYPYFYEQAAIERKTIRELIREATKAGGHSVVAGSAEQIADHMEKWFNSGAADGFAILPPTVPVGLNRFLDEVVPILQDRGSFRKDYEEGTLRSNLGLQRPTSPW